MDMEEALGKIAASHGAAIHNIDLVFKRKLDVDLCCLFWPISDTMLAYHQLGLQEHIEMKFQSKWNNFHRRKSIWKMGVNLSRPYLLCVGVTNRKIRNLWARLFHIPLAQPQWQTNYLMLGLCKKLSAVFVKRWKFPTATWAHDA